MHAITCLLSSCQSHVYPSAVAEEDLLGSWLPGSCGGGRLGRCTTECFAAAHEWLLMGWEFQFLPMENPSEMQSSDKKKKRYLFLDESLTAYDLYVYVYIYRLAHTTYI